MKVVNFVHLLLEKKAVYIPVQLKSTEGKNFLSCEKVYSICSKQKIVSHLKLVKDVPVGEVGRLVDKVLGEVVGKLVGSDVFVVV